MAVLDALGNPVRFILTAGQHSEIRQANALIEGFSADYVIADKGYDADLFIVAIESGEAIAVIPPIRNRTTRGHTMSIFIGSVIWLKGCFKN